LEVAPKSRGVQSHFIRRKRTSESEMPKFSRSLLCGGLFLALAAASNTAAQGVRPLSLDAKDVLSLQDSLLRARISADATVAQENFSDDGMYIHSSGVTQTKDEYMSNVRRAPWTSYEETEREVHVYRDVAVTHALLTVLLGDKRTETVRTTGVYAKHLGKWTQVSWQSSIGKFVDPPKPPKN
jgi:hypothetical protein